MSVVSVIGANSITAGVGVPLEVLRGFVLLGISVGDCLGFSISVGAVSGGVSPTVSPVVLLLPSPLG